MRFVCAHCGDFSDDPDVEMLDSGTTMTCEACGKETIVDLSTPEYRKKLFEDAGLLPKKEGD